MKTIKKITVVLIVLFINSAPASSQYRAKEVANNGKDNKLIKMPFSSSSGEKGISIFEYEKNGLLKRSVWKLLDNSRSSINTYKYDKTGNIIEKNRKFSDNITSTEVFKYDTDNHLISESFKRSDGFNNSVKYTYDDSGKLLKADWIKLHGWYNGSILFHYDKDGMLEHAKFIRSEQEIGFIKYKYDGNNNMIEEYWEFPNSYNQTFTYIYGTTTTVTYTSSNVFITNTKKYRIKNENYNFNKESGGPSLYYYSESGKLEKKIFKVDGKVKTETVYNYDKTGLLTSSLRSFGTGVKTLFKYKFNKNRKLTDRIYSQNEKIIGSESYEYKNGLLIKGVYKNFDTWLSGTLTFEHDKEGKPTKGVFKGDNDFNADIFFNYDGNSNISKIHWEFSFGKTQTYTFGYEEINTKIDYRNDYCGESLPDTVAKLFAPGFISTNLYTRDLAITPDGKEIYFCVNASGHNIMLVTKQDDFRIWSDPKPASFIKNTSYMYYEPFISYDGKRMFFLSNMPNNGNQSEDIWCVDRVGDDWGEPYNLGEPINTPGAEFFATLTKKGTLYFTRQPEGERAHYIFRSKLGTDGKYLEPEKLPEQVNCGRARYNAYISPDEDFIIVPASGMKDSYGGTDYYIVFRNKNDEWSEPINMGHQMNTEARGEYSASLSPDGKYLFFMSDRNNIDYLDPSEISINKFQQIRNDIQNGTANIYWISTEIIKDFKPKHFK